MYMMVCLFSVRDRQVIWNVHEGVLFFSARWTNHTECHEMYMRVFCFFDGERQTGQMECKWSCLVFSERRTNHTKCTWWCFVFSQRERDKSYKVQYMRVFCFLRETDSSYMKCTWECFVLSERQTNHMKCTWWWFVLSERDRQVIWTVHEGIWRSQGTEGDWTDVSIWNQ